MPDSEDATQLGPLEALALETFGLPLLAYLCATDEHVMRGRLQGTDSVPPAAENVLTGELVPLAQYVAAQLATQPHVPRSYSIRVLGMPTSDGSTSIGIALRRASGGEVADELLHDTKDDPVKFALTRMAIDSYPLLLAPTDRYWRVPQVFLSQHPLRVELQAAVQSDVVLRRMFTEDDPRLGTRGFLYTSLGHGGSFQDALFGDMVIVSAWDMASMTTPSPTLAQLVEQVHRSVDTLREAVNGGRPTVRALLVFTGFTTRDEQAISTPWGLLRPLNAWERELAPPALEGGVSHTNLNGSNMTVSYAGEMVLEMEVPYVVVIDRMPEAMDGSPKWPALEWANALRRTLEGVQLAVLLATDRPPDSWVAARLAWTWTGDPFGHGGNISWSDVRSSPGFLPYELSSEECDSVGEWAGLVDSQWMPRIDIAIRRFLSAANARTDMADRDAVIVWENLFGTSEGEPRLRISAALAWLLAHEPATREALQIELRNVYDYRSKIVHGNEPNATALAEQANNALTHTRDALRALFRDRPDVLSLPDGAARSLRVIMGG
jgi:Apea-like HEPN